MGWERTEVLLPSGREVQVGNQGAEAGGEISIYAIVPDDAAAPDRLRLFSTDPESPLAGAPIVVPLKSCGSRVLSGRVAVGPGGLPAGYLWIALLQGDVQMDGANLGVNITTWLDPGTCMFLSPQLAQEEDEKDARPEVCDRIYGRLLPAAWAAEGPVGFLRCHEHLLSALPASLPVDRALQALAALSREVDPQPLHVWCLWAAAGALCKEEALSAVAVASLASLPTSDTLEGWAASPEGRAAVASAGRALRALLASDAAALLPTFAALRFAPLLRLAGVDAGVHLRPPRAPAPPQPEAHPATAALAPATRPSLDRSRTLLERDADWERAARSAARVLQRHYSAVQLLGEHTKWTEEWLAECWHRLSLVPGGPPPAAVALLEAARPSAARTLRGLQEKLDEAETNGVEQKVRQLAARGEELRQHVYQLVQRFGSDVGSFDPQARGASGPPDLEWLSQCWISTAAGFHPELQAAGTTDGQAFSKDGIPRNQLDGPLAVASLDDNLWIVAQPISHCLRIFDARSDTLLTVAGRSGMGLVDGQRTGSRLRNPSAVLALSSTVVLVADTGNHCLRLLRLGSDNEELSTLSGQGVPPGRLLRTDGPLKQASMYSPCSLALAGNVVVVGEPTVIRVITGLVTGGQPVITTIVGTANRPSLVDGVGKSAGVCEPLGMAAAPWDSQLVFFTDRHLIRSVHLSTRKVTTVAGFGKIAGKAGCVDGTPTEAMFNSPQGLTFLPQQAHSNMQFLLIADTKSNRLRALLFDPSRSFKAVRVETVAGRQKPGWRDGQCSLAVFNSPTGLAADTRGNVLIADNMGHRLRWFWQPEQRAKAMKEYDKLREPVPRLAGELSALVRSYDLGDWTESLQRARSRILETRGAAVDHVYRQQIEACLRGLEVESRLPEASDDVVRLLLSLAPSPALLQEALERLFSAGTKLPTSPADLARAAVTARLCGHARAPGSAEEPPAGSLGQQDLRQWLGLAAAVPEAFGPPQLSALFRAYGGQPCESLLGLCRRALLPGAGDTLGREERHDLEERVGELSSDVVAMFKASVAATLGENERITPEKLLRGTLQSWAPLLASGPASTLQDVAEALLRAGLSAMCAARDSASSFLTGVRRGLSVWLAKNDPSGGPPMPLLMPDATYALLRGIAEECFEALPQEQLLALLMRRDAQERAGDEAAVEAETGEAPEPVKEPARLTETPADLAVLHEVVFFVLPSAPAEGSELDAWAPHLDIWASFVIWAADEVLRVAGRDGPEESFTLLKALAARVAAALGGFVATLEDGAVTVDIFSRLERLSIALEASLKRLGLFKRFGAAMEERAREMREARADVEAVEAACEGRFSPSERHVQSMAVFQTDLHRFTFQQIRAFLGSAESDVPAHPDLPPLPPLLIKATPWLRAHTSSLVFDLVWERVCGEAPEQEDVEARVRRCAAEWGSLSARMLDGSLTVKELSVYSEALEVESEISLFIRSSNAACDADFDFAKPPARAPRAVTDAIRDVVKQFSLLVRARHSSKGMQHMVELLANLVRPGSPSVPEARKAVEAVCSAVDAISDWDGMEVRELPAFGSLAERVDQRMYHISEELVRALQAQAPLLGWLACTFPPPDQNFTSAVEMALGKPEMECPPELWVERSADRPGHPDETKLSMLTSVRQSLYGYLYRGADSLFGPFETLAGLVDCLSGIVAEPVVLSGTLAECGKYHLAFADILALEDTGSGAVGRLLTLQRPERAAKWAFAVSRGDAELQLVYTVQRNSGVMKASQTLAELLDFQSTMVLARFDEQSATSVNEFVASFGWAQELAKCYQRLASVGHFAFLEFEATLPMMSPPEGMRKDAERLRCEVQTWGAFVEKLRSECPALNWFTMWQLQRLSRQVRGKAAKEDVAETLAGIFESRTQALDAAEEVARLLREDEAYEMVTSDVVHERGDAEGVAASDFAQAYAELRALAQSLAVVLPRSVRHRVVQAQAHTGRGGATIDFGVCVGVGERPLELALAAFLRNGSLPEWPLLLCCSRSTTWEEVTNLLHRWATFEAPQGLFCICGVDLLPSAVSQDLAAALLRHHGASRATSAPLLLISRTSDHHLTRQLAPFRITILPPSAAELQLIGRAMDASFSQGVTVLSSRVPGTGKSFAACARARRIGASLARVPLHSTVDVAVLLTKHSQELRRPGPLLVHAEIVSGSITDSADTSRAGFHAQRLDAMLLELFIFGSLHDVRAGQRWSWDPESTTLCIEVPSGSLLEELSVLRVLPHVEITTSRASFCGSPQDLCRVLDGVKGAPHNGAWAFEALEEAVPETVSLSSEELHGSGPSADDLRSVQAVCKVLRQSEGGCWTMTSSHTEILSGAECFDILSKVLVRRLRSRPASAATLLAFARVMHWQLSCFLALGPTRLQQANMAGSAANAERGQIASFFSRTAADFTLRQERPHPKERTAEWLKLTNRLYVDGQEMGATVDWLQRTAFDSCGQPVFRMGTLFDPTYVHYRDKDGYWVEEAAVKREGPVMRRSQKLPPEAGLQEQWARVKQDDRAEISFPALLSHTEAVGEVGSLKDKDEERIMAQGEPGGLATWDETNHEVLLVGVSSGELAVDFLARDTQLLKRRLHPRLVEVLERSGFKVGTEIHKGSSHHHRIMCQLTGVTRDEAEAAKLVPGGFCLTGDGLLKLIAIYVRARCGVPVVLQGECGTGKTHMLRYLCAWLRAELRVLDVHGGTSEGDIEAVFAEAHEVLASGVAQEVFVFLDEVNTCAHMDLICEAICSRSLHGRRLDRRVRVLAAANPYRRRTKELKAQGLSYSGQQHGGATSAVDLDPLRDLVYRVHPIPPSLCEFLFDFGGLKPEAELQYILSMASAQLPSLDSSVRLCVAAMLQKAMAYVRDVEGDHSAVSLRDVHRAMKLAQWFLKFGGGAKADGSSAGKHPMSGPMVLGIAHVFYFRLATGELRSDLMRRLRLETTLEDRSTGFEWLKPVGVMEKIVLSTQRGLCSKLVVQEGVAMNAALMENLYVTLVCICNKVPVFVVGKPGSSKTLTMQVLASNLQGPQSPSEFWRKFPALYIFSYQCSPLSTAMGIKHQYEIACNYQKKAFRTMTVLLLDEVGLAEHSPDMPLKVLHGILVRPKVSVVGLSNWTLDAAKMNRAICLQRPNPSPADIHLTGVHLLTEQQQTAPPPRAKGDAAPPPSRPALVRSRSGASSSAPWLEPLSRAYHEIYMRQKGRDFLGMRDYYQMVQWLWREVIRPSGGVSRSFNPQMLCKALCRNFSGREDLLRGVLEAFGTECFGSPLSLALRPPVSDLVRESLADQHARHMMLLTTMGSALPLLFSHGLVPPGAPVLVGSAFPDDQQDLYIIQHVNRVKSAMAAGDTIVLWNLDSIYESLYDVLNQRYVVRTSEGRTRKSLRLAIGARSQLCPVEDGFRIIVVVEKDHAYENLDLPLLNRFEKFLVDPGQLLVGGQVDLAEQLGEWMRSVADEIGAHDLEDVFCGSHAATADSLALVELPPGPAGEEDHESWQRARRRLADLASPLAMMQSHRLRSTSGEASESDRLTSLSALVEHLSGEARLAVVLTKTPLLPVEGPWATLRLAEMPSEARLAGDLAGFFGGDAAQSTLIVQCDPQLTPQATIDHARLVAERCARGGEAPARLCLFVVHLPPSHRLRRYSVTFQPAWQFFFIDEIRCDAQTAMLTGVSSQDIIHKSLCELIGEGALDLEALVRKRIRSALAMVAAPGGAPLQERAGRIADQLVAGSPLAKVTKTLVTKSLQVLTMVRAGALQVPYHVDLALGQLSAGSLRMSLEVAIDALVVRALGHSIALLDVNSALDVLADPAKAPAWQALAERFLDTTAAAACRFDGLLTGSAPPTRNTGVYGHLCARFPFSHRLQHQLEALGAPAGAGATEDELASVWEAWCAAHLGESVWKATDALRDAATGQHLGYLHDAVLSGAAPRIVGVGAEEQLELHRLVIADRTPKALLTPPGIHWALRAHQPLLLATGTALSMLPAERQREILAAAAEPPADRRIMTLVEEEFWALLAVEAGRAQLAGRVLGIVADLGPAFLASLPNRWLGLRCAAALSVEGRCDAATLAALRSAGSAPSPETLPAVRRALAGAPGALATALRVLAEDGSLADEAVRAAVALLQEPLPDAVRRSLVATFCARGAADLLLASGAPAVEVLRLLLAHEEDTAASAEPGGALVAPYSLAVLRGIAAARRAVEAEVAALLARAQAVLGANVGGVAPRAALPRDAPEALALYGLRCAHQRGGLDALADLLVLPPAQREWLRLGGGPKVSKEVVAARSASGYQDVFPLLLGEAYGEHLRKAKAGARLGAPLSQAALAAVFSARLGADFELRGGRDSAALELGEVDPALEQAASADLRQQLRWMRNAGSGPYRHFGSRLCTRAHSEDLAADPAAAQGLFALTFHALGVAAAAPGTYLVEAVENPHLLKSVFLPGMPWEAGQSIFEAMRAENVTWYRCPNGHLYSIGECGGPVLRTRCSHPGCNRVIGGVSHTPAAGNTRLGNFYEMHRDKVSSKPGYDPDNEGSTPVRRMGYTMPVESVCFHRLLLHLLLLAGAELHGRQDVSIAQRLSASDILGRLERDFRRLKAALEWTSPEVVLGLHMAFKKLGTLASVAGGMFDTTDRCERFEIVVDQEVIRPIFLSSGCHALVSAKVRSFRQSRLDELVRQQLGDARWQALMEDADVSRPESILWRLRPRASFEHLVRSFKRRGNSEAALPVLRAFLLNEERLSLVGMLADILAWHRVLFRALGASPLAREDAAQRTNRDIVDGLPPEEREEAEEALVGFCRAFNRTLPLLTNLWECQRNPFLTDDGRVDLSASSVGKGPEAPGVPMSESTPLHFALPSHPPGPLADAPGLCSIQILNFLVRSYNEVCGELAEHRPRPAPSTSAVPAPAPEESVAIAVGAETPPAILRQRLLVYDRQRDLLPLLFEFSRQSSDLGAEADLEYDFEGLEVAICSRLLAGKRPLALQIRHYLYAGEARARGSLAALQGALPQVAILPAPLVEAVRTELDTREQVIRLLSLLEEAMRFVVAVGAGAQQGGSSLAAYLRDVAMVEPARLADLPPLIAQEARLAHVRALFLAAEEMLQSKGEARSARDALLPAVLPPYRAKLPGELRKSLLATCGRCAQLAEVLPTLRDLLTGILSDEQAGYAASESLRDFLTYEDVELELQPWFAQFPAELRLAHALEAYRALAGVFAGDWGAAEP